MTKQKKDSVEEFIEAVGGSYTDSAWTEQDERDWLEIYKLLEELDAAFDAAGRETEKE